MECAFNKLKFDKIYCINLVSKPERLQDAMDEFKKIGLENVTAFHATDAVEKQLFDPRGRFTPGMMGCFNSHWRIFKEAFDQGLERIMVFEDDITFVEHLNPILTEVLKSIPQDWEFAWLGYKERGDGKPREKVSDWWAIPKDTFGTHAYMVNSRKAIINILARISTQHEQIDVQMARKVLPSADIKYYSVFPVMVKQSGKHQSNCQYPIEQKR